MSKMFNRACIIVGQMFNKINNKEITERTFEIANNVYTKYKMYDLIRRHNKLGELCPHIGASAPQSVMNRFDEEV